MTRLRDQGHRLVRWWGSLSPRRQAFLRWLLPLLIGHALVAMAYWFHQTHSPSLARDQWTLKTVGFGEAVLVVILVAGSRRWPIINLGIAFTAAATAGVYIRLFADVGPQPVPMWEVNMFRAYYWVGVPLTLLGASLWAVRTWIAPRRRRRSDNEGVLK